jgi:hypothetical protein
LSSVNTEDTKDLLSSIGLTSNEVKSIFDLGPPFDDINATNPSFSSVATDPDYDLKQILTHIKPISRTMIGSNIVQRVWNLMFIEVGKHCTAQGVDALPYLLFENGALERIFHLFNESLTSWIV